MKQELSAYIWAARITDRSS